MSVNVIVTVYCNTRDNCIVSCKNIHDHLHDSSVLKLVRPLGTKFNDIFHECADICDIDPLYLPLFALRENGKGRNYWIKLGAQLNKHLQSGAESNAGSELLHEENNNEKLELEFRIRFTFKSECQVDGMPQQAHRYSTHDDSSKPVMNDKVTKYLFHQRRSDFLNGRFSVNKDVEDEIGVALGVAVLDILRLACEMECDLRRVQRQLSDFKKLLPAASREVLKSMNFCNRIRVQFQFRHYIQHFAPTSTKWLDDPNRSVTYFHSKYLRNLELVIGSDNNETYKLSTGTSTGGDCNEITVGADCGIVKGDVTGEQWCDFNEITDMNIQAPGNSGHEAAWNVTISKLDGKVLTLSLPSLVEVENLASCIDGYYQLLVDAHHYLCKDVCSPSLVERLKYYCHGPLPSAFAECQLRSQPGLSEGDCLLRQSQQSCHEYFINTVTQVHPNIVIKNYKLDRQDGLLGIYGDNVSHHYKNLSSLIDACSDGNYNGGSVPFQLDRLIHPSSKQQSNLLVYRCSDTHHQVEDGLRSDVSSDPPSAVIIMQRDYKFLKNLGDGRFTSVMLHANKQHREHLVVIKDLYEVPEYGLKQRVEESFQDSKMMLNYLKNDHIIQQIGIMKNMMVLEYVPLGSITEYLQRSTEQSDAARQEQRPSNWGSWFIYVLWQLTHACNYLEEKECAHGNIRGKNVLLWQAVPQVHVKLSDSGVRTCCRTLNQTVITEPVLPAPWLAYEFCRVNANNQSACINYPSVNGDKWSFATTVCEICNWGNLPVGPVNAYDLPVSMRNAYENANVVPIPETLTAVTGNEGELCSLIRQCWSSYPPKRPPFKQILRELGTVLSSDYVLPSIQPTRSTTSGVVDNTPTILPDIQTYEDANLVLLKRLGEGHFGCVELYVYDRYRNGRTEKVAVKSLHNSMNSPRCTRDFKNEMETMRRLNHQYVVKLKGVTEPSLRIVMEYLPCGSLTHYLRTNKERHVPLSHLHKTLLEFASQISQGMLALQEKRLIHRDLALRNILLARRTHNSPYYVKISDFGLSRILKEDSDCYVGKPDEFPAQWYAPECLRDNGPASFHFQSDVWSFGVTVWEMFSYGERPTYSALPIITVHNLTKLQELLQHGNRLLQPRECPRAVYDLISQCWIYEPHRRIAFEELRRQFDRLVKNEHG